MRTTLLGCNTGIKYTAPPEDPSVKLQLDMRVLVLHMMLMLLLMLPPILLSMLVMFEMPTNELNWTLVLRVLLQTTALHLVLRWRRLAQARVLRVLISLVNIP